MTSRRRWVPVLEMLAFATLTACGTSPPGPSQAPSVSSVRTAPSSPSATASTGSPAAIRHAFPVAAAADYGRTHHDYPATDIFAACGSPVQATVDGVVLEVSRVDNFEPDHPRGAAKGGLSVSIRGDDDVRYYGSHLSAIAPGIDPGVRVSAGQRIGDLGRTGNASNICHLHFGLSPVCAGTGDWWNRRGVVHPWPYLDAWRAGQHRSPAVEVTAWQRSHGCPSAPPAGEV